MDYVSRPKDARTLPERFWEKVAKAGEDDCWEWTAGRFPAGYGCLSVEGVSKHSHRLAWELTHGPIPKGEGYHGTCVRHKCDNRGCCNPKHLELGTAGDNNRDRVMRGRSVHLSGVANGFAKITGAQVAEIREALQSEWSRGGVTQRDIAARYGIDHAHVSYINRHPEFRSNV